MSSLPNEVLSVITYFLPNDDITDLMLLSRNFNALVTPRLKKIDEEMTTVNQHIESFMPSPAPARTDHEWISQLNLKRFEPIGTIAKKRMKDAFHKQHRFLHFTHSIENWTSYRLLKKRMSLERFDDPTFFRILGVFVANPEFRQEYNVSRTFARSAIWNRYYGPFSDVVQIWSFYNLNR